MIKFLQACWIRQGEGQRTQHCCFRGPLASNPTYASSSLYSKLTRRDTVVDLLGDVPSEYLEAAHARDSSIRSQ